MVRVAEHRARVVGVGGVDGALVLRVGGLAYEGVESYLRQHTEMSKPMALASVLTSSRSSSTEGSLVLLFSQCHKRGPGETSASGNGVVFLTHLG